MEITKESTIEDLSKNTLCVNYLREKGIRCIRCGEPIWGTLEDAALEKGFSQEDIVLFVEDLNRIEENK